MNYAVPNVPLCVDLDNTLVRTNTLVETIVGALRQTPGLIVQLPFLAMHGQSHLWAALVERFRPDASSLPYSEEVVELIRREVAAGRSVVLTTEAHERVAQDVAQHLGLFSAVIATHGNPSDPPTEEVLSERFGDKGFDYVGGTSRDLASLRLCRRAYVVSGSPWLAARLKWESIPAIWIAAAPRNWRSFVKAARPHQWVKNVLVFVPVILGHRFLEAAPVLQSAVACGLLCLASSSVYLFNDILDVESDRRHPTKRNRPFASGKISIQTGVAGGLVLSALALGLGLLASPAVGAIVALYLISTMLYSVWLKKLLIVDMMMLASFYVLRVYLGAAATGIRITFWTALFCLLVFTGLAAVKRYAELHNRAAKALDFGNRRAYTTEDGGPLLSMGTSCFVGAVIALGLYLGSPDVREIYKRPDLLWLICPILLGWSSRLWILGNRGELRDEDPLAFAMRDRWSHSAALILAIVFLAAL